MAFWITGSVTLGIDKSKGYILVKYRYLIFGIINAIVAVPFIIMAILPPMNFWAGVFALVFMFFVGHCWNKDTQRVLQDKENV